MEIIKDINGGTLRLTSTSLTERTGESIEGELWQLALFSLVDAIPGDYLRIYNTSNSMRYGTAQFSPRERRIGCRYFSNATFNKILKAASRLAKK